MRADLPTCVRSVVGQDAPVTTPVKVRFALERDEDGWPPAESEGLWAENRSRASDLYRLDNTPWFVRGVAAGDVVQAHPDTDGVLWFVQVRERGGRMTVRVIPRHDGSLDGNRQRVLDMFLPLGVGAEGMSSPVNMVALDIGPDAPLSSVKSLLASGESDGRWYVEEGCISEEWRQLP
jgi:hypothetical protein